MSLENFPGFLLNFSEFEMNGFPEIAAKRGEWELGAMLAGAVKDLSESIGSELTPPERHFRDDYLDELKI